MSGSEPIWAEQNRGGWWSSTAASAAESAAVGPSKPRPGMFRTRLAVVEAVYNDGSLDRVNEIAAWVAAGGGAVAYVERLTLGNWGVVVLRPERPDALWVLTDQYLVLDPRRRPQLEVFSSDEFSACYEHPTATATTQVRECPIFDDGEVAS